jgi:MFS family permease
VSLGACCTAAGLVWLAFADLGVAIPTIADEFDADLSTLQWANNAFSLVTGALVIAAGKFGDIFGGRRVLMIGIVLFAGFSVVAALAQGLDVLIAGRALAGIGAAAILPATLALIPVQFSGASQLTAFGAWQAVAWGGQAVGPAIGGVITDSLGWSFLFWLNLPLAAVALDVIRIACRRTTAPHRQPGDEPGFRRTQLPPGALAAERARVRRGRGGNADAAGDRRHLRVHPARRSVPDQVGRADAGPDRAADHERRTGHPRLPQR